MSSFEALANKFEGLAGAHGRAVAAAATTVQTEVQGALGPHHRTGDAESTFKASVTPQGIALEEIRYQKYIRDVPRGAALRDVGIDAYNASIVAQLGAGLGSES